jgi:hypothetical protein
MHGVSRRDIKTPLIMIMVYKLPQIMVRRFFMVSNRPSRQQRQKLYVAMARQFPGLSSYAQLPPSSSFNIMQPSSVATDFSSAHYARLQSLPYRNPFIPYSGLAGLPDFSAYANLTPPSQTMGLPGASAFEAPANAPAAIAPSTEALTPQPAEAPAEAAPPPVTAKKNKKPSKQAKQQPKKKVP